MFRYLVLFLCFLFLGCEINSQQIVKPEKFNFNDIKFNAVTKKLNYEIGDSNTDTNDIKHLIKYWFDNKIKTNGFDGTLEVVINKLDINRIKQKEYYKISIELNILFKVESGDLTKRKTYDIKSNEYGEIKGSFAINDQENLDINIIHQSLKSISQKLKKII